MITRRRSARTRWMCGCSASESAGALTPVCEERWIKRRGVPPHLPRPQMCRRSARTRWTCGCGVSESAGARTLVCGAGYWIKRRRVPSPPTLQRRASRGDVGVQRSGEGGRLARARLHVKRITGREVHAGAHPCERCTLDKEASTGASPPPTKRPICARTCVTLKLSFLPLPDSSASLIL
jgi:hypothetical protein